MPRRRLPGISAVALPGVRRQGVPRGQGVDGMPMPHVLGVPWLHPIFSGFVVQDVTLTYCLNQKMRLEMRRVRPSAFPSW